MKEILNQLASYSFWANKILMERLNQLPPEIFNKENGSSFGSIYNTVFHLMQAETIWWQRLKLLEPVQLPADDPSKNFRLLSEKYLSLSRQLTDWVIASGEKNLSHVFGYYNSKKEYFKQPVQQVLLHLFNHETYHRGQIITMLRQSGVDKIPATDFIVFSRKK